MCVTAAQSQRKFGAVPESPGSDVGQSEAVPAQTSVGPVPAQMLKIEAAVVATDLGPVDGIIRAPLSMMYP